MRRIGETHADQMFRTTAKAKDEGLNPVRIPHYPIPISVLLEQSVFGFSGRDDGLSRS